MPSACRAAARLNLLEADINLMTQDLNVLVEAVLVQDRHEPRNGCAAEASCLWAALTSHGAITMLAAEVCVLVRVPAATVRYAWRTAVLRADFDWLRNRAGGRPNSRLKARLKDGSDS